MIPAVLGELAGWYPLFDKDQDARPRVGPHFGVLQSALARALVLAGAFLSGPVVIDADAVPAQRRCHHVWVVHQMNVVELPRREQVLERKTIEIVAGLLKGKRVHGTDAPRMGDRAVS